MKPYAIAILALGSFSGIGACASTPGARPSDMSVAEHESAAGAHENEARPHADLYDPNAQVKATRCDGRNPCWAAISNPTEGHLEDAKKHRKMAADHRAAAQALRGAEASACVGISDDDRDISPFYHREDIAGVQPAYVHLAGKQARDQIVGASVAFRAVPGMTAEWLQRVVDCHIARNNALGNDMPEMPYCPLVPKGINAKVSSTGNGFAVTIESQDPNTAQEVLRRAQALTSVR
jgi:hypothetical protein